MFNFESAALSNFALASSGLGENVLAIVAGNDGLSMTEHNVGLAAASTLDIHEVGVRSWDESFELVGLSFVLVGGVKEISIHLWKI